MDASQAALLGAVLAPFLGAGGILAARRHPNVREGVSLAAAVAAFALAAITVPAALNLPATSIVLGSIVGLPLALQADALGVLFATLASFLWILTTVYSVGYMRGKREHAQTRYFACFAIVMGATMGVALSANLFSLFLFYEILTIATYPLVVHEETEEAFAAGRKYLVYTLSGGVAILAGLAILLHVGGLGFVAGGNPALASLPPGLAQLAFFLLFAGFGVKAAIVPIHGWLPSAMVAPTPVSGLLHAVAVVKAGVFGILRTIYFLFGASLLLGLGLSDVVIIAAVLTIFVGSFLALIQDDFKLRLAYSTVSQLSYIILGAILLVPAAASGSPAAVMAATVLGAAFFLVAHAFAKLTMFFVAGAVAVETGKTKVSELDGLGRRMPRTFAAFSVATMSMVGLPPLIGFLAKDYLGRSGWGAGAGWVLPVFAIAGALNLAYFLPILVRAYFRPGGGEAPEARRSLRIPLLATATGAVVLGIWAALPYGPFRIAAALARDVTGTMPVIPGAELGLGLVLLLAALIAAPLVLLLKRRARSFGLITVLGAALLGVVLEPEPAVFASYGLASDLELLTLGILGGTFLGVLLYETARSGAEGTRPVEVRHGVLARGVLGFAEALQASFANVYAAATVSARALFAAGRRTMRVEDRDVNWNLVAFSAALVLLVAIVLMGGSP